jgi:F420H(2)-dependent quinone reductase
MGPWGALTSRVRAPQRGSLLWAPYKRVMALNVRLFRISGGRIGGKMDAADVLVLHHRGAKSGKPRETPLLYVRDGEAIALVASFGGSPKDPAWLHNLRAHPDAEVELGRQRVTVTAREATDAERGPIRAKFLEVWPVLEVYESRTSRRIPFVMLEPRSS